MLTVHMLIGIPGSGKTTFANKFSKEKNIPIVSTDVVRKLNPVWDEKNVWPEVYRLCGEHLKNNEDFIFDATNVTPKVRKRFFDQLSVYNVEFDTIAYFFDTDFEVCYERVVARNKNNDEHYIPVDVVASYSQTIIPPTKEEGFKDIIILK